MINFSHNAKMKIKDRPKACPYIQGVRNEYFRKEK